MERIDTNGIEGLWFLVVVAVGVTVFGCGNHVSTHNVPMLDGVELVTDVYRERLTGSYPTIVMRTPYGREGNEYAADDFVERGYAAVTQDIRGTGDSGGEFVMFVNDGWGLTGDGRATVEWAAEQTWSDGRVGLWGGSALAIAALLAAGSAPPSLGCAFSLAGTGDLFHHFAYQGGALREELCVYWHTMMEE